MEAATLVAVAAATDMMAPEPLAEVGANKTCKILRFNKGEHFSQTVTQCLWRWTTLFENKVWLHHHRSVPPRSVKTSVAPFIGYLMFHVRIYVFLVSVDL